MHLAGDAINRVSTIFYGYFGTGFKAFLPFFMVTLGLVSKRFYGRPFSVILFGRAPASQGRCITGFASLGASHASPLHTPHAKTLVTEG
jgi:hypothetical protein